VPAKLEAFVKQKLHADTNAEQGTAGSGELKHGLGEPCVPQLFSAMAVGTDTRENDPIRRPYLGGRSRQPTFTADSFQGAKNTVQISHPIVDDVYFHSAPKLSVHVIKKSEPDFAQLHRAAYLVGRGRKSIQWRYRKVALATSDLPAEKA